MILMELIFRVYMKYKVSNIKFIKMLSTEKSAQKQFWTPKLKFDTKFEISAVVREKSGKISYS